jgi:hypothetical protein
MMARFPMWRCRIPIVLVVMAGCFYPPQQKPLATSRTQITLALPYDLAWRAVNQVIARNDFRIVTQNPDEGTIEAQAVGGFSLADADCGRLEGIAGKYSAEPGLDASAVYDFEVKPRGNEAASVRVQATFTAPVHVPFHLPRGEQCFSRGRQEARLLDAIARQAQNEHRLDSNSTQNPPPARETVE